MKGHKKLFEEPIFGQNWKEKPLKLNTHGHINLYDLECEITCKRSKIIIDQKLSTHKKVYSSAPHVPDQPESTKKRIIFTQIHRKGKYGPKKLTHVAACISDSSWHVVSKPKSEKTPRRSFRRGKILNALIDIKELAPTCPAARKWSQEMVTIFNLLRILFFTILVLKVYKG